MEDTLFPVVVVRGLGVLGPSSGTRDTGSLT